MVKKQNPQPPTEKDLRMVWLDMEMSGLEPPRDKVLELAMIVTDHHLTTLAVSPVWVVHQSQEVISAMDKWNQSAHGKSGLIDRVLASTKSELDVESEAITFLKEWVGERISPICGNSVHQDRRFLNCFMPKLENYFHYRNIDVSTLKELARRWSPALYQQTQKLKQSKHEALADIQESIEEMRYYRDHFLNLTATPPNPPVLNS